MLTISVEACPAMNAEAQSVAGVKVATTLLAVGVKLYVSGTLKLIFL
jgi:hypothetical protein